MANNNTYNEDIRIIEDAVNFATSTTGNETENLKDFMVNTAGAESLYGINNTKMNDDGLPTTITPYNVNPTVYHNFIKKSDSNEMNTHISNINTSFKNLGYGENFDIRSIASVEFDETSSQYKYTDIDKKYINDPYIGSTLTLSMIDTIDKPIPNDVTEQADFWAENWNNVGDKNTYINTYSEYRQATDVTDNVMDMLKDQDESPFKITSGDNLV